MSKSHRKSPGLATHPIRVASSQLPTRFGLFSCFIYQDSKDREHIALTKGHTEKKENVLCRVQSECLTGEVLCSLRCDCRLQLDRALELLGQEKVGVLIYLRQEGRGIGLTNKIKAYALQDDGMDTLDANRALGLADDARSYEMVGEILKDLGVKSIRLMTNNPLKMEGVAKSGIKITERIPHQVEVAEDAKKYLKTKASRMGHWLEH